MYRNLHPFFFIVLCFCTTLLRAQHYEFNPTLQKAYHHILRLEYEEAEILINKQLQQTPKHAIALYLKNFNDVLPVFILEDKNIYQKLSPQEKTLLNLISKLPKTSPYYYFTQAEIKLHWAMLKLRFGDHASAALNIRSSYRILQEGLTKYPDFVPLQKSMSLLKIVIGSIPESYSWLAGIVGLYGDLNKGVEQLTGIARGTTIYHMEAKLWMVLCDHYLLGKTDQLFLLSQLRQNNPDNILYLFLEVSLLVHDAHSEKALHYYNSNEISKKSLELIPAFYYIQGEIYLQKGNYPAAVKAFQHYINTYRGQTYIKAAYSKIFLAHWLNGNETEAERYRKIALNKGLTRNDSDKQAQKIVLSEKLPHKSIYKIRLMTDGGYLNEAIALLEELDKENLNTDDRIEYLYRKARLYHKSGDVEQAMLFYDQTIKAGTKKNDYFAPNSCLQMGYIYRGLNQTDKALFYFKKVFDYKNYEYQETIESKAKAGLSSLEK